MKLPKRKTATIAFHGTPTTFRAKLGLIPAIAALSLLSAVLAQAQSVFDNVPTSGFSAFSTSSTPNSFMGGAFNLAAGTTAITGFDLFPVNTTGVNYTGLKINIFVWGSVNTSGTVNATTPAFGNLLGSYSFTSSGAYNSGFYFPFQNVPGVTPGVALGSPLSVPSTQIGITINYQGTTDGVNYSSANNLTSIISSNAPTVGSEVFAGYYRNANSETDGNFTSSLRSLGGLGSFQSIALRIYTTVPEPATTAMIAIGATALVAFRRRK